MKDLFKTCKLGSLRLKNRWAMAPMTRGRSPGGIPTDTVAEYYEKRAQGGIGLIITEGVLVDHPLANAYGDIPYLRDECLDGWRKVIEKAHSHGTKVFPQVWHCGPESNPGVAGFTVEKDGKVVVHKASPEDKQDLLTAYSKAAVNVMKAGFDGLELHGAHGYLLDSFLRSGDIAFAVEIIRETRLKTSPDFPICLRFSNFQIGNFEARFFETPEKLEKVLEPLIEAGVNVLHPSTRRFWVPEFEESERSLAWWTRKISGLPTIMVGNIGLKTEEFSGSGKEGLRNLKDMLTADEFDFAAVGRPLLTQPDWVNKVEAGDWENISDFYDTAAQDIFP